MIKNNFGMQENIDASYGLIMRLNKLWIDADNWALSGNYKKWNFTLDAIWRNLTYKDALQVTVDQETKSIIEVSLSEKDFSVWTNLNQKVIAIHNKMKNERPKTKEEFSIQMGEYYQALQLKDIGLRKFMYQLKLYLKEASGNPSKSMFGG